MIKNLNQLRRTLREGTQLEILDHCRPECIGQIRNITLVNTQGFYSTVANQPDASANRGNGGRGPILWWGRAAHWQFADGVCSVFDSEQKHTEEELVMSFRVSLKFCFIRLHLRSGSTPGCVRRSLLTEGNDLLTHIFGKLADVGLVCIQPQFGLQPDIDLPFFHMAVLLQFF